MEFSALHPFNNPKRFSQMYIYLCDGGAWIILVQASALSQIPSIGLLLPVLIVPQRMLSQKSITYLS